MKWNERSVLIGTRTKGRSGTLCWTRITAYYLHHHGDSIVCGDSLTAGTPYTESRPTLLCFVSASVCTLDMVAKIRDSVKREEPTRYRHAGTKGEGYSFYSEVRFIPRPCLPHEWIPSTHWAGDWVGLRDRLDTEIKAKAVPRHATQALGGERRYSCKSFLTSALDGGDWLAWHSCRALSRGKDHRYPLYKRLGGPHNWSGHRD
jgi:hypothetical protein